MKRYLVEMAFLVWAESDKEAYNEAERIAEELRGQEDNGASVTAMREHRWGELRSREIDLGKVRP